MTRLFIHSTNPELASRMDPVVKSKILARRETVQNALQEKLAHCEVITLEIGCGHGHFLTDYAQSYPEEMCVGIDVNRGRIYRAKKKAKRSAAENLMFLECESMEFLEILHSDIQIANTWILYPDPWPKKRHFKNRIIQDRFLDKLSSRCTKHSRLYLRSDYEPYLEWSKGLIEVSPNWQLMENCEWPETTPTVFQELTKHQFYSLVAESNPAE